MAHGCRQLFSHLRPGSRVAEMHQSFQAENIDARVFFWPLSGLPVFGGTPNNPIASDIAVRAINLPSFDDITENEIERVCNVIRNRIIKIDRGIR